MSAVHSLLTVMVISIQTLDNEKLAALNHAVQGFGRVPPENLAYDDVLKLALIEEGGRPRDLETFRDACAYEVKRRVREGTFQ